MNDPEKVHCTLNEDENKDQNMHGQTLELGEIKRYINNMCFISFSNTIFYFFIYSSIWRLF